MLRHGVANLRFDLRFFMTNDDIEPEDDLSGYLQIYLDETEEQLDDLVDTMLVLESDPANAASLNAAFRLLHSMKGAAGMMGFDQITVLTHHLETRFERLRSGRIEFDRTTMNLTLRCIDFLRECNNRQRDGQELSAPDELLEELRVLEEAAEKELEREDDPEVSDLVASSTRVNEPKEEPLPDVAPERDDSPEREAAAQAYTLPDLGTDYHVVVTFADHLLLKDFKAKTVATAVGNLGEIKATRPELEDGESSEDFTVFDIIINTVHAPDEVIAVAKTEGVSRIEVRVPRDADAEPLAVWEMKKTTEKPHVVEPTETKAEPQSELITPAKPNDKINETMRVDIDRLDSLMNLAGELVVNRAQFIQVSGEIGPGLRKSNSVARSREFCDTLARAIELFKLQADAPEKSAQVDAAKWSATIGELESGLELIREQSLLWENGRRCFSRLDEAIDQLSRVSDSLQRGVLGTRMVPVGPLFSRFRRVVRDLTQDGNKTVQLEIDGENTELDKRMIDALGDPMVHLVRNSIDHGLESTEDRLAAGKPAAGTVSLSARHRGNHVTIMVKDDGGGIDADKIRSRLVSKGLMTADAASSMSDREAVASIFRPGFSTAEKVSDISGRGVGMDIVKSRIEELSGSIEIDTEVGVGTIFTLKLPLTLAIIGSLLVRIRGIMFAIPKDDVREIVSIRRRDIARVNGKQTFEVRGKFTSLVSVDDLFHWNDPPAMTDHDDSDELEIAILQSGGRPMGLAVDQSIGSQDVVIKSLADNFIGLQGLAGASILGDGSVALMLDVAELHKMAVRG